jgi:hypothetical protein
VDGLANADQLERGKKKAGKRKKERPIQTWREDRRIYILYISLSVIPFSPFPLFFWETFNPMRTVTVW